MEDVSFIVVQLKASSDINTTYYFHEVYSGPAFSFVLPHKNIMFQNKSDIKEFV